MSIIKIEQKDVKASEFLILFSDIQIKNGSYYKTYTTRFQVKKDLEHETLLKKSEEERKQNRVLRSVLKFCDRKNLTANEIRKYISKQSLPENTKELLLSVSDKIGNGEVSLENRKQRLFNLKNFISSKFSISCYGDKSVAQDMELYDSSNPHNSIMFLIPIIKEFMVSFNNEYLAQSWYDAACDELHYQSFQAGDSFLREKSAVIKDVTALIAENVFLPDIKNKRIARKNPYYTDYEKRVEQAYNRVKNAFVNKSLDVPTFRLELSL